MNTTAPIRIMLVDDHAIVREGLRSLLGDEDGFEIVAEHVAETGRCSAFVLLRRKR